MTIRFSILPNYINIITRRKSEQSSHSPTATRSYSGDKDKPTISMPRAVRSNGHDPQKPNRNGHVKTASAPSVLDHLAGFSDVNQQGNFTLSSSTSSTTPDNGSKIPRNRGLATSSMIRRSFRLNKPSATRPDVYEPTEE